MIELFLEQLCGLLKLHVEPCLRIFQFLLVYFKLLFMLGVILVDGGLYNFRLEIQVPEQLVLSAEVVVEFFMLVLKVYKLIVLCIEHLSEHLFLFSKCFGLFLLCLCDSCVKFRLEGSLPFVCSSQSFLTSATAS